MTMFRDLKADLYKTLKEIHENAYKQFNKIMKTIKGVKVEFIKEIESLRKTQTTKKKTGNEKFSMLNKNHSGKFHQQITIQEKEILRL